MMMRPAQVVRLKQDWQRECKHENGMENGNENGSGGFDKDHSRFWWRNMELFAAAFICVRMQIYY